MSQAAKKTETVSAKVSRAIDALTSDFSTIVDAETLGPLVMQWGHFGLECVKAPARLGAGMIKVKRISPPGMRRR